jgi:hypothetical protein
MCCRCLRSILGIFLGAFIVWQFAYLIGINSCEMTRSGLAYFADETDVQPRLLDPQKLEGRCFARIELLFTRWDEFTGQPQSWSLFAPNVWSHIPFVAVELRWDDEPAGAPAAANAPHPPVLLLSDNEPQDVSRYLRLGLFRLRRFESNIDVGLSIDTDKSIEEMQDRWRQNTFERVKDRALAMLAYLEWRMSRYLAEHPDVGMPHQVILRVRVYRVPQPPMPKNWIFEPAENHTLARWRPRFAYAEDALPVEVYDRIAERYDVLP